MSNIKLLDCTLRDGGYVNDWEFGHNNLIQIYERLCEANVEIVELGFIDDRRPYDLNRSIFPDTRSIRKIWKNLEKRPLMTAAMIDYGTCDISFIEKSEDSNIDIIRVIFKEHLMREALEYCAEIKELGYKVCAQLVSITSYTDEKLNQLISIVNDVKPYAVSMVDTYGLLTPKNMCHIDRILDRNISDGIRIGFHAHNNLQLAYANCIAFLEENHKHDIFVDGTLFGMGKSAGNAPIELLGLYLNNEFNKDYRIDSMLEAIDESVMSFYTEKPWGYKLSFYLSSKNKCHPNYVSDLRRTENVSVSDLDQALSMIEPESKKLLYDRDISRKIYEDYVDNFANDVLGLEKIKEDVNDREIMIVGPGKNIQLQKKKVLDYIAGNKPIVFSINYIPKDIPVKYVFVTNKYRYQQMASDLEFCMNEKITVIATSNIECLKKQNVVKVNRMPLLESKETISDNSLLMLLQVLNTFGVHKISLAGLDGYSSYDDNYFNPDMEYAFIKDKAMDLNNHVREVLNDKYRFIEFVFVTYSQYQEEDSQLAAF